MVLDILLLALTTKTLFIIALSYAASFVTIHVSLLLNSGYMAPEYAMRGYLTDKADVYSFGVVALEIVSGKSNTNWQPMEEFVYLLDWVRMNFLFDLYGQRV